MMKLLECIAVFYISGFMATLVLVSCIIKENGAEINSKVEEETGKAVSKAVWVITLLSMALAWPVSVLKPFFSSEE